MNNEKLAKLTEIYNKVNKDGLKLDSLFSHETTQEVFEDHVEYMLSKTMWDFLDTVLIEQSSNIFELPPADYRHIRAFLHGFFFTKGEFVSWYEDIETKYDQPTYTLIFDIITWMKTTFPKWFKCANKKIFIQYL